MATARRGFGAIRRLPSKRFQASYLGPDLRRHVAPTTFAARIDAEGWLVTERRLVETDTWTAPETRDPRRSAPTTLAASAAESFGRRRVRGEALRPRTVKPHEGLWPASSGRRSGERRLRDILRVDVDRWYAALPPEKVAQRAPADTLLRSIFEQALDEGVVAGPNPCAIRGAGVTRRRREIRPASIPELADLVEATPDRLRAAVVLAAWCGLRFGEVFELRRGDVDLETGTVQIRRAVVRIDRQEVVGRLKSETGVRALAVPPHVQPALEDHLARHAGLARGALLFTTPSSSVEAREAPEVRQSAAGRPSPPEGAVARPPTIAVSTRRGCDGVRQTGGVIHMHTSTGRRYESLADAAEWTGLSTRTVWRRIAEGSLRAYRVGPRIMRLDPVEVNHLMVPVQTGRPSRVPRASGARPGPWRLE